MKKRKWLKLLLACLMASSLALSGCGDDGSTGATGATGPAGVDGTDVNVAAAESCIVCHAENRSADVAEMHGLNGSDLIELAVTTVSMADVGGFPVLSFHVEDADGNLITNLADYEGRFYLAELVPGVAGDNDNWQRWSYERTDRATDHDNDFATPDIGPGIIDITDAANGNYTYSFLTAFADAPNAANVQRVSFRVRIRNVTTVPNTSYDFMITAPGTAVLSGKDTVATNACNACHDPLAFHGGGYNETTMCVNCHNPSYVPDAENAPTVTMADNGTDMLTMVHEIHAAVVGVEHDWSEITYPQDLRNCTTCHAGTDADNWKTVPTMEACATCHDEVNFTGAGDHAAQADNSSCNSCHTVAAIENAHLTENATPNNPDLPAGQREILYDLVDASINASNELVVNLNITSNGTKLDLTALPDDLAGPGRWPGFLIAWAEAQDGIAAPADFNNLGNSGGQPTSISLEGLADGSEGTLACVAGDCIATLANPFPAGAILRTVGLQGYFQQDLSSPLDGTSDVSLHTQSAVITLTGDTARRTIVTSTGCADCHEIFEGHGGNRVLTANGGVAICTLCHVPNLSSSGRAIDPADAEARPSDAYTELGLPTTDWPEATNNFKDMIHGIHSAMSNVRTQDYEFVRGRNDGIYYNWSEVTFPGTLNNCEKCHLNESYRPENIPDGALVTTDITTSGDPAETFDVVDAARDTLPNATDEVISPLAATCYSCHTDGPVINHMKLNGAAFGKRSDVTAE